MARALSVARAVLPQSQRMMGRSVWALPISQLSSTPRVCSSNILEALLRLTKKPSTAMPPTFTIKGMQSDPLAPAKESSGSGKARANAETASARNGAGDKYTPSDVQAAALEERMFIPRALPRRERSLSSSRERDILVLEASLRMVRANMLDAVLVRDHTEILVDIFSPRPYDTAADTAARARACAYMVEQGGLGLWSAVVRHFSLRPWRGKPGSPLITHPLFVLYWLARDRHVDVARMRDEGAIDALVDVVRDCAGSPVSSSRFTYAAAALRALVTAQPAKQAQEKHASSHLPLSESDRVEAVVASGAVEALLAVFEERHLVAKGMVGDKVWIPHTNVLNHSLLALVHLVTGHPDAARRAIAAGAFPKLSSYFAARMTAKAEWWPSMSPPVATRFTSALILALDLLTTLLPHDTSPALQRQQRLETLADLLVRTRCAFPTGGDLRVVCEGQVRRILLLQSQQFQQIQEQQQGKQDAKLKDQQRAGQQPQSPSTVLGGDKGGLGVSATATAAEASAAGARGTSGAAAARRVQPVVVARQLVQYDAVLEQLRRDVFFATLLPPPRAEEGRVRCSCM